ncbi:hypothetical protein GEMRC1_010616 [Eukaryota sp. GEM-RC1]
MKVNVISRSKEKYFSDQPGSVAPILKNRDPKLHPFQTEREYVRALNATKLERMFAKPLLLLYKVTMTVSALWLATSPLSPWLHPELAMVN